MADATITIDDLRWFLGFDNYRAEGGAKQSTDIGKDFDSAPGRKRVESFLRMVIAAVDRWAPDAGADAKDEAILRLAGYLVDFRTGGRSSLYGWAITGGDSNSGRAIGPALFLHSGAAQVLQEWHPLEVAQIE